jgi:ribosomal protein L29
MSDVTLAELRKMNPADLRKEAERQRAQAARLRILITQGKEKDTSKYHAARKQLARMLTVLGTSQAS